VGRNEFMQKFNARDALTLREVWQRFYLIGQMPHGSQKS